ncbi:oxidoreductase [Rhodococcus sp. NBC_00297]|uniref:oxidoreductase n=1 Tax=Rhodococcus sp. NBC_00297 TaxID=2976005 RepID=UPI002E28CA92|nr:FAD-dependent oxidoreductase [Rhodococcus sp. NBC_00297]
MNDHFPHLFSPIRIGGLTLKNRLVALPAGTSMAVDGVPTHGDTEHVERLAAGGVGLIIGGATVVHPTTTLRSRKLIEAYRVEVIPSTAAKVSAAHRHDARFIGQLCHLGREFIGGESDAPPSAPSAIKTARDAYPPHELSVAEIEDIVEGWRTSTRNLVRAGVDGVELHAAHGYLPAQFMSPLTNRRTDDFGGSFDGRMRFTRMVIEAMRSEMPAGLVLGVRLSGEEEIPGGMSIDDCVRIAENVAAVGVDYFSITHGTRGKYVKDSTGADAVAIPSAARVRSATGTPTLVGQRIRDAGVADHAIKTGQVDMVGMARALIADPELPNKSRTGRLDEIRGCLGVNQDCRAFDPHLHCAVNAEIGRGRHVDVGRRARATKDVVVIGGGPAGLEAARVAAGRGHRVTVFEKSGALGGSVRVAASAPHRATLIDIVDYLEREMRRLKVEVHLSAGIGQDDLDEIRSASDHIVVATGSRPADVTPSLRTRTAYSVDDVLLGRVSADAGRVVVFDDGDGFWPAYSAAEALVQRGWEVTVATTLTALASRIPTESAGPLLDRLGDAGVDVKVAHALHVPDDPADPVTLRPIFGAGDLPYEDAAIVWHQPRVALSSFGLDSSSTVSVIGDCVTPRRIGHAIAEGYRTGAEL